VQLPVSANAMELTKELPQKISKATKYRRTKKCVFKFKVRLSKLR